MEAVTHRDELEIEHHELGPMDARRRIADGVRLGMSRVDVAPGAQSTPAHGVRFRVDPVGYWDGEV
jgi:hypothetical protein